MATFTQILRPPMLTIAVCIAAMNGCREPESKYDAANRREAQKPRTVALAARPTEPANDAKLAISQVRSPARLTVQSGSFKSDGPIPDTYSDYGEKVSPALSWEGVPASAKSIVLIMEDPDATEPRPFIHWVLYDLPATQKSLRMGLAAQPQLKDLENARQGINSRGSIGYFGPRPPEGDSPHHYHFQLFALDRKLDFLPGKTKDEILAAMTGHVVAAGEVVGTYRLGKAVRE